MKCEQCNSETQNGFVCPDCSKNSDLNQGEFYVCNKNCQKLFWKEHKKRRQHFQALPNHEEKSKMPPWSLDDLSKKVILEIFSYLGMRDLGRFKRTSKRFRTICNDESLWKHVTLSGNKVRPTLIQQILENGCEALILKVAFFQKVWFVFKSPNLQKKIFQKTILSLKFKFPAFYSILLLGREI